MARTYLIFGDIEGKLNALRVECTRAAMQPQGPLSSIHSALMFAALTTGHHLSISAL